MSKATFLTSCPYDEPKLEDCIWYHTFDFNRHAQGITTEFELEPHLKHFLLPEQMEGRTFLDVGTANGFFTFEMERRGAEVVSFDVSPECDTDRIPYRNHPNQGEGTDEFIRGFHKGYWYAHKVFNSRARAVYGTIMDMPEDLGTYDVVLVASVLQHLRDPLGALIQVDKHVGETLIVSEHFAKSRQPVMRFEACPDTEEPQFWTWWAFSGAFLVNAMKTLGYQDIEVRRPFKLQHRREQYAVPSITVKGRR